MNASLCKQKHETKMVMRSQNNNMPDETIDIKTYQIFYVTVSKVVLARPTLCLEYLETCHTKQNCSYYS